MSEVHDKKPELPPCPQLSDKELYAAMYRYSPLPSYECWLEERQAWKKKQPEFTSSDLTNANLAAIVERQEPRRQDVLHLVAEVIRLREVLRNNGIHEADSEEW